MSKLKTSLGVLLAAILAACGGAQPLAGSHGLSPDVTQCIAVPPAGNCPVDRHGTGLLPDGDFSQSPDPGDGYWVYSARESFAPAWTVRRRSVNLVGSSYWNVGDYCSVDLDGDQAGGIYSTSFTTKRGKSYQVKFILSGNGDFDRSDPNRKTVSLQAENQIHVFTWNVSDGNDAQHGKYAYQTWNFQATRTETTLTFVSRDAKGSFAGPVVADISVTGK